MLDTSIYSVLSREVGAFNELDVLANNISNAETIGYKNKEVIFEKFLTKANELGTDKTEMPKEVATFRDDSQGTIKVTGEAFDVAIEGEGFFAIETPLGIRYTRAGNFRLNTENRLSTREGYSVLGSDKAVIEFPENAKNIVIRADGLITIDGVELQRIGVVNFDKPEALKQVGDSMLKSDADDFQAENFRVVQGALEGSNVKMINSLTRLIEVQRSVGLTTNLISTADELQRNNFRTLTKINN